MHSLEAVSSESLTAECPNFTGDGTATVTTQPVGRLVTEIVRLLGHESAQARSRSTAVMLLPPLGECWWTPPGSYAAARQPRAARGAGPWTQCGRLGIEEPAGPRIVNSASPNDTASAGTDRVVPPFPFLRTLSSADPSARVASISMVTVTSALSWPAKCAIISSAMRLASRPTRVGSRRTVP